MYYFDEVKDTVLEDWVNFNSIQTQNLEDKEDYLNVLIDDGRHIKVSGLEDETRVQIFGNGITKNHNFVVKDALSYRQFKSFILLY